ncbi:MAG: proline/glycine betaine ABC transporter permease [Bacillota bacterium]|nr:proline/glycine betaine ABC transporter permease [Bacillota bacterium]MDW7683614.1 proline/glycine betaine ABC transporter permease [Bacillota bacterium]
MSQFPEFLRFELGVYVDNLVKWLLNNFSGLFDAIYTAGLWMLIRVDSILRWLPWWLVLVLIFAAAWKLKGWVSGLIFSAMIFTIGAFGYWVLMMQTLAIVMTSAVVCLLIGIPTGIFMAYNDKANNMIRPFLDGMQTMPSFVYLIPAVFFFNLGRIPAVFATVIYAIPPVIRLTDLGIRGVSREMVEAAHSFGSSNWQTLTKVQLPQALPTIMTGVNQTTMMALAMVVIASMVGAPGLGMEVLIGISQLDIARGFEAGISIVFLAIIIDRFSQGAVSRYKFPE